MEHLLARSTPKSRAVQHHPALPYKDAPAFIKALDEHDGFARWALELLILTAARTSEVVGARWAEIDLERALWIVPAQRMKAGKEHRVPLVDRAVDVLKTVQPFSRDGWVFPGTRKGGHISNMAMAMLLRRMGRTSITVHGFRSTFRDFIAAETQHDFHTAEAALAHQLQDRVAAAYARSDLMDKRLPMMRDWATFLFSQRDPCNT
jgi:integrase